MLKYLEKNFGMQALNGRPGELTKLEQEVNLLE
jgi:hypothetical protein